MAFSVQINKLSEDPQFVYYEYGSTGMKFGKIKIAKSNGDVFLLENAESDESGSQAKRAGWKLMQHWKKGEYPDKTYWAS